jgi:hypothetical protein
MYKNYEIFKNQCAKVQKYIDFIDTNWPYRFFATLTFQFKLMDTQGIAFASEHIKRLNRRLLGRSWSKQGLQCLTGVATLEHASILKRSHDDHVIKDRGSCHFHFLLHDHPCFDKNPDVALHQLTEAWEASARSLNYKVTRKLVSARGTNVQLFETTGVYGYILKEAKTPGWERQELLFYVDGKGLLYIDASVIQRSSMGIRTL